MRLYTFTNFYLSSIQQGIQTAHVVSELSIKAHPLYTEWAKDHKTIIVLNGGNSKSLQDVYSKLTRLVETKYPIAKFNEDEQSLNEAFTCVGIVVPAKIYEHYPLKSFKLSKAENELSNLLSSYRLA
jgi:hypothetical protein